MGKQKMSIYTFLFVILSTLSVCLASDILLKCSVPDTKGEVDGKTVKFQNIVARFKVNRDAVGVYEYPNTPSVNILLNETDFVYTAELFDGVETKKTEQHYLTKAHGHANYVDKDDHSKGLKQCNFHVFDSNSGIYNHRVRQVDSRILRLASECISETICSELGPVTNNDITRAKNHPKDFGPMSLWSHSINIAFPHLIPPQLSQNHRPTKRANLYDAADSIIKMVADHFRNENNGVIAIPPIGDGVFSASKGTFKGLGNLQRATNFDIEVTPVVREQQMFGFSFIIPKGYVYYREYKAFKMMPFKGSLCADVDDLIFSAIIQMDFGQKYCRPSLIDFGVRSPGKSESYTCGRLSFLTNSFMQWFVDAWTEDIVKVIERKLEWAMSAYIYDKFDCENFRTKY